MQPRRDSVSLSEELAWESREFLRRLAAGRKCMFRVDYKVDAINREFGTIILEIGDTKVDAGIEVVRNGWGRVREQGDDAAGVAMDALRAAQAEAAAAGRGIHTADSMAKTRSCFTFDTETAAVASEFLALRDQKGYPVPAIVDAVLSGSTLKVVLLPERTIATIGLCGAQAPNVRRGAGGELEGDPYGVEAKSFTEQKVLSREVRVLMHGSDNGSRVYAEVIYADEGEATSLAASLLETGMARFSDWSAKLLPVNKTVQCPASQLKQKEIAAQDARTGLWCMHTPTPRDTERTGNSFHGRIIEVVSGDTLVVAPPSGQEIRLSLASIRAPRLRPGGQADAEPYARDAKEFLRKHCAGEAAMISLEYNRKVMPSLSADAPPSTEPIMIQMGNVTIQTKTGQQQLAEMIVRRGFATVQGAREGEERSSIFGALMAAEEYAKGKRSGIHSGKEPGAVRLNDVSTPGNAARARQYLPFFQRHASIPCVVEHVMSGSRVKLYIPKESVTIAFSPSGVKTPSRGAPARNNMPALAAEPFGQEAYQFTREHFLQREATVYVETCDKGGTFLGRLTIGNQDLGMSLLSAGLGSLHPMFSTDRANGGAQLLVAQESAQSARKGLWHDYDPAAAEEAQTETTTMNGAATNATAESAAAAPVLVTNVESGNRIYLQPRDEPRVAWVTRECAATASVPFDGWTPVNTPRANMKVLAQYSLDDLWYRAFVESVEGNMAKVYFLDYGNTERVPFSKLRPMDAALAAVGPLAYLVQLAYIKVPDLDSEWGEPALDALVPLVSSGQNFTSKRIIATRPASSHPRDAAGRAHVVLCPEGSQDLPSSVNAKLLEAGFARLPDVSAVRQAASKQAILELLPSLDVARRSHAGMYCYGDPGDSDDEDFR